MCGNSAVAAAPQPLHISIQETQNGFTVTVYGGEGGGIGHAPVYIASNSAVAIERVRTLLAPADRRRMQRFHEELQTAYSQQVQNVASEHWGDAARYQAASQQAATAQDFGRMAQGQSVQQGDPALREVSHTGKPARGVFGRDKDEAPPAPESDASPEAEIYGAMSRIFREGGPFDRLTKRFETTFGQ